MASGLEWWATADMYSHIRRPRLLFCGADQHARLIHPSLDYSPKNFPFLLEISDEKAVRPDERWGTTPQISLGCPLTRPIFTSFDSGNAALASHPIKLWRRTREKLKRSGWVSAHHWLTEQGVSIHLRLHLFWNIITFFGTKKFWYLELQWTVNNSFFKLNWSIEEWNCSDHNFFHS